MSQHLPPLAGRLNGLTSSAIRDLLKLTARAEIISLAGGLPDAALMPGERIAVAADAALRQDAALQYTESPGWRPLRTVLAERESAR
ncbi:PLP-dependent aminotransferase family protein, partial [Nocardia cyriacigeorgica]|nr:PLP-dependent aminotransferase family protein [Nocardia cyriacigeorgica]